MFGWIGSLLVIGQMASLSLGLPTHTAIMIGFAGACFWIVHAIVRDDKPLLFVNTAVLATALVGLMP
jgi:hypothetical protein